MSVERTLNPSPLAGEGGRERSERPGEGSTEPVPPRGEELPYPSPASLTLRVRSAPSPARGEGENTRQARRVPVAVVARGRARTLRERMTDAERKLWYALRDRRFAQFKFRRQVPVGPFIADFVCFERRLVIEVDGGQHAQSLRDKRRDLWFAAKRFRVLRFWNNDISANLGGVLTIVAQSLAEDSP